jgi:hypothetical protein
MWPFSTIRYLTEQWRQSLADLETSTENFKKMYQISCEQGEQIDRLTTELEAERMKLVACGVGANCNTSSSVHTHRMPPGHAYYSGSLEDVYKAVDREMALREELKEAYLHTDSYRRLVTNVDKLLEEANDRAFRASEAHVITMGNFNQALDHVAELLKYDSDHGFEEAEKFLNHHRGTKVCVKCGSEMIPMHSEDKKMCSNGACGHEVEWKLEEGQKYQHKNNVEPFVEDRSQPEEPRTQTRF